MSNQPEINSYDSGVYQIEATDPVDGGLGAITNSPLLSLANRTNYLKKHLDDIESGTFIPNGLAPLNSPALTGSPTAPTQAAGDNSTKLANTSFVQNAVNGTAYVGIAGAATTTLVAAQYGCSIIILTGAVTANKSVIFPALSGRWCVVNATTGAFTVTLKTAAGTGVVVTNSRTTSVFCDGANIALSQNDFISPALTGSPTAPTLPRFSNNSVLINASALKIRGDEFADVRSIDLSVSTVALTALDSGKLIVVNGSGGGTLLLPLANSVIVGAVIAVKGQNTAVSTNTVAPQSTDIIYGLFAASATAPRILRSGDSLYFVSDGASSWTVLADATYNAVTAQIAQFMTLNQVLATNGSATFPGSLTLKWGVVPSMAAGGNTTITFQSAFNTGVLALLPGSGASSAGVPAINGQYVSASQARFWNSSTTATTQASTYLAIGL